MSIPLTGTGGIYTRLGRIAGLLNTSNAALYTTAPSGTPTWGTTIPINALGPAIDNIFAQYLAADKNLVNGLYPARDSYRGSNSSLGSYLQTLAVSTLQQMVNDDVPQPVPTSTFNCMAELIRQMVAASATVQQPTVSATASSVVATGDTVLAGSVIGPGGVQRDYPFAEKISVLCTTSSRGTAGYSDTYAVLGQPQASGALNWDYPNGSGISTSLSSCDANVLGVQLITNPFQTFANVPNLPDNWTSFIGAPGTDFFAGGAGASYFGTNCLQITGVGTNADELREPITNLQPSTVYAVNAWVKASAGLVAGVFEFDLYDTIAAAILTDANSVQCKLSIAFGSLTTAYAAFTGFIRTPAVLPNNNTNIVFRVKVTTPLTVGQSVFIDRLAMQTGTDLYGTGGGGPFAAMFAGKTRAAVNDKYTLTIANSGFTSPNATPTWVRSFEQLFGMKALGLQLPSGGSPTISDGLISCQ